jgi:hypothetical protein
MRRSLLGLLTGISLVIAVTVLYAAPATAATGGNRDELDGILSSLQAFLGSVDGWYSATYASASGTWYSALTITRP